MKTTHRNTTLPPPSVLPKPLAELSAEYAEYLKQASAARAELSEHTSPEALKAAHKADLTAQAEALRSGKGDPEATPNEDARHKKATDAEARVGRYGAAADSALADFIAKADELRGKELGKATKAAAKHVEKYRKQIADLDATRREAIEALSLAGYWHRQYEDRQEVRWNRGRTTVKGDPTSQLQADADQMDSRIETLNADEWTKKGVTGVLKTFSKTEGEDDAA